MTAYAESAYDELVFRLACDIAGSSRNQRECVLGEYEHIGGYTDEQIVKKMDDWGVDPMGEY